ncbi:Transcription elongation factor S-II central domain [Arabidopsis suecica]|uniref:Transcription elongation factor S-II central domain n=1 Tax=Arabidopsis suecica TaxID=45249 RepID=A0A8T2G7H6_ARASU|nr:Transcription elongation factor S-II central domain [Arabidopsis suecica]
MNAKDVISRLPDEVLGRILSLISTKEAVSTSVLSKRWKNMFVLVSNLDIDDRQSVPKTKQNRIEIHRNYMAFVDKLLDTQRGSSIKKLTLKSHVGVRGGTDSSRIQSWICNVLDHGVMDLDVFITLKGKSPPVPAMIFKSKTLVKLRVGRGFTIKLSQDVSLPLLRTLCLDSVNFVGGHNVVGTLISRCPVLEELVVEERRCVDWTCSVSSPSLKRLHIRFDRKFTSISLDAPNLIYYKHSGYVLGKYPNVKLDSLIEARLNLRMDETRMVGVRNGSLGSIPADMRNLINGIRNVRILHLSSHTLELLYFSCKEMPLFDSLVSLSIGNDKARGWQMLPLLIKNSPNLETLIFMGLDHYITNRCGDVCVCYDTDESITSCLSSSQVKVLEILSYQGTTRELNQMKHFLEKLPCLELVKICVKQEFLELYEAALRAAKSVKGVKNSPKVSRFVDARNRLKDAPTSLACEVVSKTSMGKGLSFLNDHKNPHIRSEGRLLRDLWMKILYASGREKSHDRETQVKIPTHSTMKKTGDSKRDKVREILQTSLVKVASEIVDTEMKTRVTACDPSVVAVSVESAMFEKLGCFMGPHKAKYRSILFNMGDSNNPDLRRKVLIGEINGERLVTMERQEMGSEKIQKEVQRIKENARFKEESRMKILQSAYMIMT